MLEDYIDKRVLLMCGRFFYHGILVKVTPRYAVLKNAAIVYDTGDPAEKDYAIVKRLHTSIWHVALNTVESFGDAK